MLSSNMKVWIFYSFLKLKNMGLYSKLEIFQCFSIYIQIRTHSYSYIQQDIYKLGDFFFFLSQICSIILWHWLNTKMIQRKNQQQQIRLCLYEHRKIYIMVGLRAPKWWCCEPWLNGSIYFKSQYMGKTFGLK